MSAGLGTEVTTGCPVGGGIVLDEYDETLDAVTCPGCHSYFHPYFETCPVCGAYRGTRLQESLRDEQRLLESLQHPIEFTREGLMAEDPLILADRAFGDVDPHVEAVLVRSRIDPLLSNPAKAEAQVREWRMERAKKMRAPIPVDGTILRLADAIASKLTYRCTGHVAGSAVDADVQVSEQGVLVTASHPGASLARIALERILVVMPFPETIPAWPVSIGFIFSHAVYFHDPKYHGGGVTICWLDESSTARGTTLGNRSGFLTKKGDFVFYFSLASSLGHAAQAAAQSREGGIGPYEYARHLHFIT